jgi:hypothetical protein
MFHHIWRLSEAGEGNLGLACTEEGLVLGRTALVERQAGRFVVREQEDIRRLLSRAYGADIAAAGIMHGLGVVASALNANDQGLARITAVHLRIPDLPDQAARDRLEAEDVLIKYARDGGDGCDWNLVLRSRDLGKASPDDPKHPGWPAGTEGGRGGQFRPKDGTPAVIEQEVERKLVRLAIRRAIRTVALSLLGLASESAVDIVPIVGEVVTMTEIMREISEFRQLKIDLDATFEFVKKGPRTLAELQVSSDSYEEFSSYNQFLKTDLSQAELVKRFGRAGDGYEYHHIVTQGGENASNIPPNQLQNTDNIIRLPKLLHEEVSAEYFREFAPDESGRSLYEWLQTQPYEVQRERGLRILRELHILK